MRRLLSLTPLRIEITSLRAYLDKSDGRSALMLGMIYVFFCFLSLCADAWHHLRGNRQVEG